MDQKHENSIDLDQVLIPGGSEKKKVARKRWGILAKALKVCLCPPLIVSFYCCFAQSPTASEPSSPTDECSVRRISSFMLLTTQRLDRPPLDCDAVDQRTLELVQKRTWYKYAMVVDGTEYFVNIGTLTNFAKN